MKRSAKHRIPESSAKWFREARYGMFIHYGLYSILGRREWALFEEAIPLQEYRALRHKFKIDQLDVSRWVKLAKASGMKYMCLTTRHHDGYALFKTNAGQWNLYHDQQRDLVREYADACHREGLGVGVYYSIMDWSHPGWMKGPTNDKAAWREAVDIIHVQLKELMSNYGEIKYLFYDGAHVPELWQCAQLNAELRKLQPGLLITRSSLEEEDDVVSREQFQASDPGKLWESCITMNESWGYNYGDWHWKTPGQIAHSFLRCVNNNGNFLLNIGPKLDGSLEHKTAVRLTALTGWVNRNKEALFDTRGPGLLGMQRHMSFYKANTVYVPLHWYFGPKTVIGGIRSKVKKVRIVPTGKYIKFSQTVAQLKLTGLPEQYPDDVFPIIALEMAGKARQYRNPYSSVWL